MSAREYGNGAILGIAVPQANPVVEPEFSALLPAGFSMLVTRLKGSRSDSRQRLIDYLRNLEQSLDAYDSAPLDAVGYACTGSSYLVGAEAETRALADASERFGYPVVSSAQAIRSALDHLGMKRIAVFAPYPDWLVQASIQYWTACGMDVAAHASVALDTSDTRDIYEISTPTVLESFAALRWQDADAIVFTGTGMPTLRAITEVSAMTDKPVLSSNLCLAWSLVRTVGGQDYLAPPGPGEPLFAGWATRIPV
jgi:maleate isomerase